MTPKEKAKQLYDKYFSMIKIESPIDRVSSIPYVKKCALIVVDEMIEMLKELDRIGFLKQNSAISIIEEVKKEIEAL